MVELTKRSIAEEYILTQTTEGREVSFGVNPNQNGCHSLTQHHRCYDDSAGFTAIEVAAESHSQPT